MARPKKPKYIPLKDKFIRKGFRHVLVQREGDKAIFRVCIERNACSYEVVKIKKVEESVVIDPKTKKKEKVLAYEEYPDTNDWGTLGWTFQTLKEAEKKFKRIRG